MPNFNLLERNLDKILDSAGFNPELRKKVDGYEIDVYLEHKNLEVVFECKQYEKSNLTVRNLIHQWEGKQKKLGVDKVVLVLVGISFTEEDLELAEETDIKIWNGDDVERLLNKSMETDENFRKEILAEIGLSAKEEVRKLSKDEVHEIQSQLQNNIESENQILTKRDREKLYQGEFYYGTKFLDVVEKMVEYNIEEKKKAYLLVGNQGGSYDGKEYRKTEVKRIKRLMDELEYNFDDAKSIIEELSKDDLFQGQYPTKKFLDRALNVKEDNENFNLYQIKKAFNSGYSVGDLKTADSYQSLDIQETSIEDDEKSENINKPLNRFNLIKSSLGALLSVYLFYQSFAILNNSISLGLLMFLTAIIILSFSMDRYLDSSNIQESREEVHKSMTLLWLLGILIAILEFLIR